MRDAMRFQIPHVLLIAILLVGGCIVVFDGLTRGPTESVALDPLTYEPYPAARIFAATMLPLPLLYAASVRAPLAQAFFFWLNLCSITYSKDFAYIRWGKLPFFVTDGVLTFELGALFLWFCMGRLRLRQWLPTLFQGIFFLTGAFILVVALTSRRNSLLALRDFALVAYSWFLLVGLYLFRGWKSIRRLGIFFGLGAGLATLNGLAWFFQDPHERRYIHAGGFVLLAFIGTAVFTLMRLIRLKTGILLSSFFGLGLLLYNARSIYVALFVTLGLCILTMGFVRGSPRLSKSAVLAGVALIVLGLAVPAGYLEGRSGFVSRNAKELLSGTIYYSEDPQAQFRFLAWQEAFKRFARDPVFGEGYGIPFEFYGQTDPRPHNTFLTVLYKMGVVGFLPFVFFLAYFFRSTWQTIRSSQSAPNETACLYGLFLAQAAMCVVGLFTFVLESPFTASIFWANMGIGFRLQILLSKKPRRLQNPVPLPRLELYPSKPVA